MSERLCSKCILENVRGAASQPAMQVVTSLYQCSATRRESGWQDGAGRRLFIDLVRPHPRNDKSYKPECKGHRGFSRSGCRHGSDRSHTSLQASADFKVLLLTSKALNGLAPSYLSDLLTPCILPQPLHCLVILSANKATGCSAFFCQAPFFVESAPTGCQRSCNHHRF